MTDAPIQTRTVDIPPMVLYRTLVPFMTVICAGKMPRQAVQHPRLAVRAGKSLAVYLVGVAQKHGLDAMAETYNAAGAHEAQLAAIREHRYEDVDREYFALFTCMAALFIAGKPAQIHAAPGWLLRRATEWLASPRTFENVFEPVLSDMQLEFFAALAEKRPVKARWVQLRGYGAFWSHFLLQVPFSLGGLLRALWRGL